MADINITTSISGLDQVTRGLDSTAKSIEKMGDSFIRYGRSVSTAGLEISRLSAPLAAAGAAAVLAAGHFEQTSIAMETMIGNTKDAHKFLAELKSFAASTPFTFTGIADASKQLMAMGFEAKGIIPIMETVGNATSALGTGQEGINRIVYALGQMRSATTLNSQDMRQLQQAFINGWQYIATATGKSMAQVKDEVSKGMVSSREAVRIILEGMANDPRFEGMMVAQSQTLLGVWSNFQDQLGFILIDIGNSISETLDLKGVTQNLVSGLKGMLGWWNGLSDATKQWIVYIGAAVAAAGPLLVIFGQLSIGVGGVFKLFSSLVGIFGSPFLLAAGAAVAAIGYIITITDSWGVVIAGISSLIRTLWDVASEVFASIGRLIGGVAAAMVQVIKGDFKSAWDTLKEAGKDIGDGYKELPEKINKTWTVEFGKTKRVVDDFTGDARRSLNELSYSFNSQQSTIADTTYSYKTIEQAVGDFVSTEDKAAEESRLLNAQLAALGMTSEELNGRMRILGDLSGEIPEKFSAISTSSKTMESEIKGLRESMIDWGDVARSTYGGMTSGFGQMVSGILVRGRDWKDSLQNFFKDVLANFVAMIAEMTAQWIILNAIMKEYVPFGGGSFGVGGGGLGGLVNGGMQATIFGNTGSFSSGWAAGGQGGFSAANALAGNAPMSTTIGAYLRASMPWMAAGAGSIGINDLMGYSDTTTAGALGIIGYGLGGPIGATIGGAIAHPVAKLGEEIGDLFGWARGGETLVSQPTMFIAGEHGPEMVSVSPSTGMQQSNGDIVLNGPVVFDGVSMAKFARMLRREMNR